MVDYVPFVIFALPRSRSAWTAKFLSYKDWNCGHDQLRYARGLDDVKSWLQQPNTGTVETAAAPWWRLLKKYRPDTKVAILRRPIEEVVDSLCKQWNFDKIQMTRHMRKLDSKLLQIAYRWPGAVDINFADLDDPVKAGKLFKHCLPYQFDTIHHAALTKQNIQCSFPALMRYVAANEKQLTKLCAQAKQSVLLDFSRKVITGSDGIKFQVENFNTFLRDGQHLFAQHLIQVGEPSDSFMTKNIPLMRKMDEIGALQIMTIRSNGKMFGYLMTVLSPSFESESIRSAVHTTFFVSNDLPGFGIKLQRVALQELLNRGITDVLMQAGVRGSGQRISSLYKRLGAVSDGELYRIRLEN